MTAQLAAGTAAAMITWGLVARAMSDRSATVDASTADLGPAGREVPAAPAL